MAVKKTTKKENTALQQLKKDLNAGTPARLYFFFGEEVYLRDSYLTRLKGILLEEGFEDFNLHTLTGKDCTPVTLGEAIDSFPMMSERTLVLVEDYDIFKAAQSDQDAYAALLEDLPEYLCLVFVYDTIKLDQRTIKGKLGKLVKGTPALVPFQQQEATDLIPWITSRFRQLNRTIARSEAEYLLFVAGSAMSALSTEIEKVAAYSKSANIARSDIDAVCDPVLDAVVFQMTEQLAQGKFEKAAAVLADLFAMQQPPQLIMGALSKQVRQLYTARVAYEQQKSAQWLAEIWGSQPWMAERLLRNARTFPAAWYRTAVKLTTEADRRMKFSYKEEELILTELLACLAEAAGVC